MFSTTSNHLLSIPNSPGFNDHLRLEKPTSSWRKKSIIIRCCYRKKGEDSKTVDYYKLLGVSVDSNPQQIKEAYRKLQKKHHPDIAGQRGHEYTIMLNEAYHVLMTEDRRRNYNATIGRSGLGSDFSGLGYSSWKGPFRSQALFVDENACIGCRECVHYASNAFMMDDTLGCARVKVQFGDDDKQIEVSIDSCPVNCIHWVDREELPVLEYLIRPQPKEAYGVFRGGWERPSNVFVAAKAFNKQLKQQDHHHHQRRAQGPVDEETTAQVNARAMASIKIKMEQLSRLWSWMREIFG
ncbi:chaperone protein dnaJ C76, chloroplastic-like [Telopea speciosissima]|uniref:chaperone protein dnaJ C76, chloroplastic-like n=1 Tax=Telopea speciosissima TaxID=54955 RepID=UPI001CC78A46|nr:chaperone protein dnaJ C76, chloroplastic-like [Telopea speciosissima]XP_043724763.1 chaperone protein dnaJ C76, chloroplastic-like [Telopea speciosissima]